MKISVIGHPPFFGNNSLNTHAILTHASIDEGIDAHLKGYFVIDNWLAAGPTNGLTARVISKQLERPYLAYDINAEYAKSGHLFAAFGDEYCDPAKRLFHKFLQTVSDSHSIVYDMPGLVVGRLLASSPRIGLDASKVNSVETGFMRFLFGERKFENEDFLNELALWVATARLNIEYCDANRFQIESSCTSDVQAIALL